jgi:hypothetical protein
MTCIVDLGPLAAAVVQRARAADREAVAEPLGLWRFVGVTRAGLALPALGLRRHLDTARARFGRVLVDLFPFWTWCAHVDVVPGLDLHQIRLTFLMKELVIIKIG